MFKYIHYFKKLQSVCFLLTLLLAVEGGLYANGYGVDLLPHYTKTEWVEAFSSDNIVALDDTDSSAYFSQHSFKVVSRYIAYHVQQQVKVAEKITQNTFLRLKARQEIRVFLAITQSLKDTTTPPSLV